MVFLNAVLDIFSFWRQITPNPPTHPKTAMPHPTTRYTDINLNRKATMSKHRKSEPKSRLVLTDRGAAVIIGLTIAAVIAAALTGQAIGEQAPHPESSIETQTLTAPITPATNHAEREAFEVTVSRNPNIPAGFEPCEYEDSNNCYWDAGKVGNGIGCSFTAYDDGKIVYWKPSEVCQ